MQKIIIKIGTSTLTQGTQKLSRRAMLNLVQQLAYLHAQGVKAVVVSSGAVATGRNLFGSGTPSKQTLASIGQVKLMQVWTDLFDLFDLQVGQVLLSKDDFSSITRSAIEDLLAHRVIPIINENDTTSSTERCVGDNDNLAALVGELIEADTVIILTDQEGLFSADPRLHADAELIHVVETIDEKILALGGETSTSLGTGGMSTKLEAAQKACKSGMQTIIASAARENVLIDLYHGRKIGTLFI